MTENPTREEVLASIVPRSDQLNAEDLLMGPINVEIKGVRRGTKEQPIFIDLVGYDRSYRPCKTCRRILIATCSDDPKKWVGQQMTLFCDPTVLWAGVKVGGIRISHLSGLTETKTFLLTISRGKREECKIQPLQAILDKLPKYTDILGWNGLADEKRAGAILNKIKPLFVAKDVAGMKAKLAKLDEIETDFPPADLEDLRGTIWGLITQLKEKQMENRDE